ncbi:MAG TPA: hypothetical protein ENL09_00945 [Bacteroidetes bacterium]|nr:hypothetical protein [Bacteroidota bacterium]
MGKEKSRYSVKYIVRPNVFGNKAEREEVAKEERRKKRRETTSKSISKLSKKQITYKKGNPLKSILKTKRSTVTIRNGGSSINLMKGTW